jgi:hypothetical protein
MRKHDPENSLPANQLCSKAPDSGPIAAIYHGFWAAMCPYLHGQSCVTNVKDTCPVGQGLAATCLCGNRDRALDPLPGSLPVPMRELGHSSRRDSLVGATLQQNGRGHPLGRVASKVETVSLNVVALANSRRSPISYSANVESSALHHHIVLGWAQADAMARRTAQKQIRFMVLDKVSTRTHNSHPRQCRSSASLVRPHIVRSYHKSLARTSRGRHETGE